jgi:hypothetical protein
MGYKELAKEAVKSGAAKTLTAKWIEWSKAGQQIIGKLIAKNIVKSTAGGSDYKQYLFDTDDGHVKFALGSATDSDTGQLMTEGGIYSVTFKGQEKLKGGRKINRFEIIELSAVEGSPVGGESDTPV